MTAISHTTKPKKGTNVGKLSSDSQPAPLEGDSTTESHTAADTPKVPQHAPDRVGPLQSSAGLDTTRESQKEPKSIEPEKVNVGTASSESPPAPPKQVEVHDSTTGSRSEADASTQSSTGLDTINGSQKEPKSTEPEKVNVGTASSESAPAPPKQVEVHDSTTGSHSEADASTQSSTGLDTTPVSQKALHTIEPERTQTNTTDVDTALLAKISGSLKTQCTTSNIDVPAQDSHLSSEVVKDGTVSDLPSHAARSGHNTTEVMDQNEKSSNPSEGVSTPLIEKASDPAQVEDSQATTPSMEEDAVNQRMAKYEEAIRGLKAKLLSMETFASQQAGNRREEIEKLESKISGMKEIVDQQKQEYKEEIESFKKAIVADMGQETPKEIRRLEGKHEKEVQRLEAIVVDTDKQTSKEIERLERKHEKVIQRLEAIVVDMGNQSSKEIERLERKHEKEIQHLEAIVVGMGNQSSKEIERIERKHEKEIQHLEAIAVDMGKQTSKDIERLERKHGKEIQHLEAIVVDMDKQTSKEIEHREGKHGKEIQRLEVIVVDMGKQGLKEIERLQPNVSSEEDAKQSKTKEPPQAQVTKHSTTATSQRIGGLDQESGIKKKSLPSTDTSASGKQTNIPLPQTVVPKADSMSVIDVANLVKPLNAEIEQMVELLTESLSGLEPPASDNESEIDELRNYLGPWLCDKLREFSEPDPLLTQITLQTGLANACSSVVNDSPLWCDGSIFHGLYRGMAEKEGQAAADEWRAKAASYLDLPQCEDANKKYLTEVVRKLATAAVGGTLKAESLLSQHNQQIEVIARLAAKLHKTITEDVTSSELITYTVSCNTEFDASQMADTETKRGSHGKVICTQEMGLLCRKRVEPKKPRGPLKDWGVTMKAKVILAATLEAYGL